MDLPEAERDLNDFQLRQNLGFGLQKKKTKTDPRKIQNLRHFERKDLRRTLADAKDQNKREEAQMRLCALEYHDFSINDRQTRKSST
jgi:hypothetical protein